MLLVNLGSPDSTKVSDVRKYLREFLMDKRVLDASYPIRFCVVHFAILPTRPKEAANAYKSVWLPDGSPLVVTTLKVAEKLRKRVSVPVEPAMRYQNPSILEAMKKLDEQGVNDLLLIPLFPHYAMSSFETIVERVKTILSKHFPQWSLTTEPPFYNSPDYIDALFASASEYLEQDFDHLLFSFHSLPERHLHLSDPTKDHCLRVQNCCEVPSCAYDTCYRHQCFETVKAFVKKANLPESKYSISFQSRLGRDPWLKPYTDQEFGRLTAAGVKRLLVICPAFVSDCLETIEEIGIRGKKSFLDSGGSNLTLIPSMNEHPKWIDTLKGRIENFT